MTDTETKVRRIAEWMGSAAKIVDRYERDQDGTVAVIHDIDPLDSAADRERVMLAMPGVAFSYLKDDDGMNCTLVQPLGFEDFTTLNVSAPTIGLAFIDAVCQYLDAQAGE